MKLKSKCPHCQTLFPVSPTNIGEIVNCPNCFGRVKISKPSTGPDKLGMRYNFECPACESQLEAAPNLAGKTGRCPSCAAEIIIPAMGRMAELIAPAGDPDLASDSDGSEQLHAVHAFAASGLSAPQISRLQDGRKVIRCPKCSFNNEVAAVACGHCATPFSMEGAADTAQAGHTANMSMIFGLISLPFYIIGIFQILAIIMALRAIRTQRASERRRRYPAYIGLILGALASIYAIGKLIEVAS